MTSLVPSDWIILTDIYTQHDLGVVVFDESNNSFDANSWNKSQTTPSLISRTTVIDRTIAMDSDKKEIFMKSCRRINSNYHIK